MALVRKTDYSVTQQDDTMVNHIHVTTDSLIMSASTRENRDCVKQGIVLLDNKDSRILGVYHLPTQSSAAADAREI